MLPLAYFGIESSGLNLVIDLLILFVVVLYLSLIYWTYADARRRIADPMLVGCATAASLFPYVGTIVYLILRPPEFLEDVRERELEMQAAAARLYDLDHSLCPHCDYRVERDFLRCPSCLRKLKERCESCSRPLDQAWAICPYCETEVPGAASRRPRRRRPPAPVSRGESEPGERVERGERPERGERIERGETAAARAAARAETAAGRSGAVARGRRLVDDDRTEVSAAVDRSDLTAAVDLSEVAAAVDDSAPPRRRGDRDGRAPVAAPKPAVRPRPTN